MKKAFFQHILKTKSSDKKLSDRPRLLLETLENRMLLNADWGFEESCNVYQPSSSEITVDMPDLNNYKVDLSHLTNYNADVYDDLVLVNYSNKLVSVYAGNENSQYTNPVNTTISTLNSIVGVTFGDIVGNDGIEDLIVVSQDLYSTDLNLVASVYRGNSDGSFVTDSVVTTPLNTSIFSSGDIYFDNLNITLWKTSSNNYDLVVQGSGTIMYPLGTIATLYRTTAVYSSTGSGTFSSTGQIINGLSSSGTADPVLQTSANIKGSEMLVTIDNSSNNILKLVQKGSSAYSTYKVDLTSVDNYTLDWVVSDSTSDNANNILIAGGKNSSGDYGILVVKITGINANTSQTTFTSSWVTNTNMFQGTNATIGDMTGDNDPDIFVVRGTNYTSFIGDENYEFSPAGQTITSPYYHSSYLGDVNNDGINKVLAIGNRYAWIIACNEDGTLSETVNQVELVNEESFSVSSMKAVFGDFNNDNLLDFVLVAGENGTIASGNNLYLYTQNTDGSFVLRRQTAVSGLLDVVAGNFSEASFDELAVLSSTSGSQTIQVYSTVQMTLLDEYTLELGRVNARTIYAGNLYNDNIYDDIVTASKNSVSLVKNSGTGFLFDRTLSTETGLSSGYNTSAIAIGDINNDFYADIVFLNAGGGDSTGHIGYFLQSADGWARYSNNSYLISGQAPIGLALADFNGDGMLDAVTVQVTNTGKYNLYGFAGGGNNDAVFGAGHPVSTNVSLSSLSGSSAFAIGHARLQNDSYDLVLVGGKTISVQLNSTTTQTAGYVNYLCQSLSQATSANYQTAQSNQRNWIDEYSNFYFEVWAASGESSGISSFTFRLNYKSDYFTVTSVEGYAANGFTVTSYLAEGDLLSFHGTGDGTAGAGDNMVLVARIRFTPTQYSKSSGGVAIPENGIFTHVANGFAATTEGYLINGNLVEQVSLPQDL
ncbi:MAG: VCBS repeat-containing protein, partial [Thermoguttaceae bacterium]|nr:VCBS repeat-containing protein [Thermoguttaceae bacterium]